MELTDPVTVSVRTSEVDMRRLAIFAILWLFAVGSYGQSGPELDALWEVVLAKDVNTLLRHLPPELGKAVAEMPVSAQRELAEEFLISARAQKEGRKLSRPDSGPVLVIERVEGEETKEEAEIFLDRQFSDGDETLLRFRIEAKDNDERDRDIRVSVGMRYVEGEWRIYEVEGGQALRLDDTKLIERVVRSRDMANEASAIGSLRTYNTAIITYSATYPDIGFPASLAVLGGDGGTTDHAGLVDNALSSPPFQKYGYRYTYIRSSATEYTITARPVESGSDIGRSFFTDQTGVIRYTEEDRDPTVEDKPLQ